MKKLTVLLFSMFSMHQAVAAPNVVKLQGTVDEDMVGLVETTLANADGPVTFEINSPGGSLIAAIRIENDIEDAGNVTCKVRGMAASAAFSILQSCKIREMSRVSFGMIHQVALSGSEGETRENDADNTKKVLHTLDQALCEQLSVKSKLTAAQICKMIDNNHEIWMTPNEALKLGFIDLIF